MSKHRFGWASLLLLSTALQTGCMIYFPSSFISGLILHPDTSCERLADFLDLGDLPQISTPDQAGLQYEPISFAGANGRRLAGWYVPAQYDGVPDAQPLGTVLILHGTDATVACTIPWVLLAAGNGLHVVTFDYQGFGNSEGAADIATLLDDADAALQWILTDESSARQRVHLLGTSLGTGPALGLAVLRSRPQVQSVALDGAYDPEALAQRIESRIGGLFPLFGLSARLNFFWLFSMRERLPELSVPAMFIVAENDTITPAADARAIYERAGGSAKSYWSFAGRTHVQPLFLDRAEYVSLMVTFWRAPTETPSRDSVPADATIRVPSLLVDEPSASTAVRSESHKVSR